MLLLPLGGVELLLWIEELFDDTTGLIEADEASLFSAESSMPITITRLSLYDVNIASVYFGRRESILFDARAAERHCGRAA